jgi:hypothetical protein
MDPYVDRVAAPNESIPSMKSQDSFHENMSSFLSEIHKN